MTLSRITDTSHPIFPAAAALYAESFPAHEQREPASQSIIMRDLRYHYDAIYDNDVFVGIILYWETENFVYIEHFCILPELRGRNYGQRALNALCSKYCRIILEIDPPVTDIAARRKSFYERCGFAANAHPHTHPPYHANDSGHSLTLMSYPCPMTDSEYDAFNSFLTETVMSHAY